MKYPKLWNGPSPVGEALVRALQRTGSPFLSAHAGDVTAGTMNGPSEVKRGSEGLLLSLGHPYDTERQLARAKDARTPFTKSSGWGGGNTRAVLHLAGGFGLVLQPVALGVTGVLRTRSGSTLQPFATFTHDVAVGAPNTVFWSVAGSRYLTDGVARWSYGFAYRATEGGVSRASYSYTLDGGETWATQSLAFGEPGYTTGFPRVARLTPTSLLMLMPAYGRIDRTALLLLGDNGASYQQIDPGPLVADHATAYPHGSVTRFATWVNGLGICALADESVLVVAGGDLYSPTLLPSPAGTLRLYRVNKNGGGALLHAATPSGSAYLQELDPFDQPFVVGSRPVFLARCDDAGEAPTLFVGSPDGSTWETRPMPRPQYATGHLFALDEATLACPMYDADTGEHRLFATTDFGATWTKRALIHGDAPAPNPTDRALARFGVVTLVRRGRLPAHIFPGAPWVGDARIAPPWETQ